MLFSDLFSSESPSSKRRHELTEGGSNSRHYSLNTHSLIKFTLFFPLKINRIKFTFMEFGIGKYLLSYMIIDISNLLVEFVTKQL